MPKRLILLRHAKSAWDNSTTADIDRPLSSRGRKAAPMIGAHLGRRGLIPDLVLCSTAQRTMETLDLVSAGWPIKPIVKKLKSLYLAMPREMMTKVQSSGGTANTVMLVGHNPGIEDLASWLSGDGDPALRASLSRKFPTGAIAVIEFNVDEWRDADAETGQLVEFTTPKQIERGA